ncbi:phospholipase D-like domain-containing protein [Thermococcus piezophilus]|uniref:Phospholipase n=1 Tax=Thermococcus piezophilus TaxID=1712654 RepID=A0A172WG73_9EURY|nr:phospholipase D-like domain-containing protein [Thermococcus piezophilus]ANF22336.1 phospholipase [Thermococcus piezophilus]
MVVRVKKALVFLLIITVLSAGCLGGTQTVTTTVTEIQNHTLTETVSETHTEVKVIEPEINVTELTENLSLCVSKLSELNSTLAKKEEELSSLKAKYESCLIQQALGNGAGFEILLDNEYYYEVLNAINNAGESIYIMMFSMKYDPADSFDWANDLIRALAEAEKRGVSVHVLLEDSSDINRAAYDYLKANGVDVSFDSPETTLHAKVVVIDGKIVFLGSHNWSESALYWNHEVSIKIVSEDLAKSLINYFRSIR